MREYIVTITPRGETEPVVGCVVSSRHDPRSAWGRYSLFSQMSQDAGQITVWMGSHGQKTTVADKWAKLDDSKEWTEEAGWTHLATSESDAPDNIA